jgi:predicted unusual protein kinase regulating ubiquinone biosynthesis (AarF/ABC1/UbiB family)
LSPLLAEAKRQLAEEADYLREGDQMRAYGARLAGDARYRVPALHSELTTSDVLAMEFLEGQPIETLAEASQDVRDRAMTTLIELVLREIFEFGVMQTDPNFANFRWQPDTGSLVLLDFGATRVVQVQTVESYRALIAAGLAHDRDGIRDIAVQTGFLGAEAVAAHRCTVDRIIAAIDDALGKPEPFDFGDRAFVPVVQAEAVSLVGDRSTWHVPDAEKLFVQRKISGTAMLGARLKARVDVVSLARAAIASSLPLVDGREPHLAPTSGDKP